MKAKVIHQTYNIKPRNPLRDGKNLARKQNLNMFLPLGILVLLTVISFFTLSSSSTSAEDGSSNATDSASVDVGVSVALACTLSGSNTSHAITLSNGNYNDNIAGTTLHTICNGSGNYNIYAIGYTNNTDGNNVLDGKTSGTIPTGTTLDGNTSNWAMKLAHANGSGDSSIIQNGYNNFSIIPSTSTKVVEYNASTTNTTDSTVSTTYGVSISPNQPAGTYTGQVKYTMNYTANPPYIQDYTLSQCRIWAKDGNVTVIDKRDGSDYTVRYINGACWMTTNLALGADTEVELTSATSNVSPAGYTLPASSTEGFSDVAAENIYNSNSKDCSDTGMGCYGYYTYAAATAGTNPSNGNAEHDICPAGWRLPNKDELTALSETYIAGARLIGDPFFGVYAGSYIDGSFYSGESDGYYWSSTSRNGTSAYYLSFHNSTSSVTFKGKKSEASSIRCVAKN